MRFSIILPVYNVAKYLPECVTSLLNQQNMTLGLDYELIFVNDGSTDNSYDVLIELGSDLSAGFTIVNQKNRGVSSARNEGLQHAKGEFIWFVDPDDWVVPQALSWADTELKNNPCFKVLRYYNLRVFEDDWVQMVENQGNTPPQYHAPKSYGIFSDSEQTTSFRQSYLL